MQKTACIILPMKRRKIKLEIAIFELTTDIDCNDKKSPKIKSPNNQSSGCNNNLY